MQVIFICLSIAAVLAVSWAAYRLLYVRRKTKRLAKQKLEIFKELIRKLGMREKITEADILPLAENPSTRHALFGILEGFGRKDLFPLTFDTLEKSAESFLVNWLEFPTELNACPDEIEFYETISLEEDGKLLEYFVFRFKKSPPPPGFSDGWILGVAGPYQKDSRPYEIPLRVFSRFNEMGTISTSEEVRWVHEHIGRK